MKKSIFKSKTFWVNTAVGAIAVYELITNDLLTALGIPKEMRPRVMELGAFGVAVLNIWLRTRTTQPIKTKKDSLILEK
jgi:hypothetical protein